MIYRDDADRLAQLDILAQAMDRFDAQVLAYCQMGNHFHLVLHTRAANLSRLMRHLNGVYTHGSGVLPVATTFTRSTAEIGRRTLDQH